MQERQRKRENFWVSPGTITWNWLPGVSDESTTQSKHGGGFNRSREYMTDWVKKPRQYVEKRVLNSDLQHETYEWSTASVGYSGPTIGGTVTANYPHPYMGVDFSTVAFIPPTPLTYMTKLYASTQPFRRSNYSMWVQAREMLELATLFQLKAASFLEMGANAYLNVSFGWIPFLNDMKTVGGLMLDHQKRVKELTFLANKGWYSRKKVHLASFSRENDADVVIASMPWPVFITGRRKVRYKVLYTGSVRWGLVPGAWRFFEELEAESAIFSLALEKMIGLEKPSPQDIWNIIPFSWLIDYFIKIDEFLGANFDDGLFEVTEGSVVRRQTWDCEIVPDSRVAPTGSVGKLTFKKTSTTRKIVDNQWKPRIRFTGADLLSPGQWGVLAALLIKFKLAGSGKPPVIS